jgi:hypothetical protein
MLRSRRSLASKIVNGVLPVPPKETFPMLITGEFARTIEKILVSKRKFLVSTINEKNLESK